MSQNTGQEIENTKPQAAAEIFQENPNNETGDDFANSEGTFESPIQMRLQIMNVLSFIICIVCNATSQTITGKKLGALDVQCRLSAASWAFSIWSVIYFLMAIFVVYQALPKNMVPKRNNELIFGQIKYVFSINMVLNGGWLFVWLQDTTVTYGIGTLIIALMAATNTFMMMQTTRAKTNMVELFSMRVMFTLYTGWVTAATIINISIFIKKAKGKSQYGTESESFWACIILYIAWAIYTLVAFRERNPLYVAVYIWAVAAIRDEQSAYPDIQTNGLIVLILAIISLVGSVVFGGYEKREGKYTKGMLY